MGSNDAEVQSIHEAEVLWGEQNSVGAQYDNDWAARAAACHQATAGCLITDSRGGCDSVMLNESANLGLASARSAVQAYALKQSLQDPNTHLVWVASDWNLADALTKTAPEARRPLEQFLRLRKWRVRFDPEFIVAAKKANKTARQVMNDETENLDAEEDLGLCGTQWQEEFGQRTDGVPDLEAVRRQGMRQ